MTDAHDDGAAFQEGEQGLPLWLMGTAGNQSVSADDDLAQELERRFTQGAAPLVLSGDMGRLLQELPHSQDIEYGLWNLSEDATLGELHALFRDAGAEAQLAHTALCSEGALQTAGIAETMRQANEMGVRAARSCGPRFVIGEIGPCGLDVSSPEDAHRARQMYQLQAGVLVDAGCHGLLVCGMGAQEAALAVRAVKLVTKRPVIASLAMQEDLETIDGLPLDHAFEILSKTGVNAIGIEGIEASGLASEADVLADTAKRFGLLFGARPCLKDEGPKACPGLDERAIFAACADALLDAGCSYIGAGAGTTLAATSAIAERCEFRETSASQR